MARMTGAEALVASLLANGIDTIFTLPGVQNDPLCNALYDAGDKVRVIQSRHEQGAAYMALAYALAGGRVGCYAVVPGPGFLNTTAALSTAYATNARVLCISGQIPSTALGKGYGLLHEIPDQLGVMRSLTKWAERIEQPGDAPAKIAEAIRQMHTGRPRPVGLEMSVDVMAAEGEVTLLPAQTEFERPTVDSGAVEEAAKLLGEAENPLIFVGGGAVEATEQIAAVAELLQAPVLASRMGRGVLGSRHALSHTMPVGHRLWADADAVLAVGTRLQIPSMNWGLDGLKIVRIDIDPEEHSRHAPPAVAITAHSRDALAALIPLIGEHNRSRVNRGPELAALKAEAEAAYAGLEPQLSYVRAIRDELPDDGIFVDELTQIGYVSRFAMPVYKPRTFINTGYQGTLGWGMPAVIGAKVACPEKPVLGVAGDGGFMFNVQELATAVQQKLDIVMLVFNDNAFGNVKRLQKETYGGRVIASELVNPDFVKLAESFGAQGLKATSPEELRGAIRKGFDSKGPTLIEIPVGEMPDPWPHVVLPKVRGEGAEKSG